VGQAAPQPPDAAGDAQRREGEQETERRHFPGGPEKRSEEYPTRRRGDAERDVEAPPP
jgi:hypothetical protein